MTDTNTDDPAASGGEYVEHRIGRKVRYDECWKCGCRVENIEHHDQFHRMIETWILRMPVSGMKDESIDRDVSSVDPTPRRDGVPDDGLTPHLPYDDIRIQREEKAYQDGWREAMEHMKSDHDAGAEQCLAESPPMPVSGYLCTEPKGHSGTHRCEYATWPNRTWDESTPAVSPERPFASGEEGGQHSAPDAPPAPGSLSGDEPSHAHVWVSENDQAPRCHTCGAAPENPAYRIPSEDCACGGGMLGHEGYEHSLERCGPPPGDDVPTDASKYVDVLMQTELGTPTGWGSSRSYFLAVLHQSGVLGDLIAAREAIAFWKQEEALWVEERERLAGSARASRPWCGYSTPHGPHEGRDGMGFRWRCDGAWRTADGSLA